MSDSNVGTRRKRNIRENLFVLYSIINESIRRKKDIDIQFYDLAKCFDTMWAEESMNDLYDAGVRNEKFALMSQMNEKCKVKVKTPVGETDTFELSNIEMQGTVPAPLKCAVQIETLGRYCYTYNTGCYEYKNACLVPPLGMIDDIAAMSHCGDNSIIQNAIINTKIETKKLRFNYKKCVNMHVGKNREKCRNLKVHENQMLETNEQRYLGDIVSSSGSNNPNIKDRCNTGHSAIAQIKSLMNDICVGKFRIQIGLILRNSIFLSKMLLNSEVWCSLTKYQIEELEKVDRILIRHILNAHSKTSIEWLYAETGILNIKCLIQIGRLMYLWHILSRDKTELLRRVYETQKISSNVGDWVRLVELDKLELQITMSDEEIQGVSKEMFKTFVKEKVTTKFIQDLKDLKMKHSKSKYLECSKLEIAEYLIDPRIDTKKKQLLFKLRSRTLDVKSNFESQNENQLCISCGLEKETQGHLLQCPPLVKNLKYVIGKTSRLEENHIYCDIDKQINIVNIYSDILEQRDVMRNQTHLEDSPLSEGPLHPSSYMRVLQHTSHT